MARGSKPIASLSKMARQENSTLSPQQKLKTFSQSMKPTLPDKSSSEDDSSSSDSDSDDDSDSEETTKNLFAKLNGATTSSASKDVDTKSAGKKDPKSSSESDSDEESEKETGPAKAKKASHVKSERSDSSEEEDESDSDEEESEETQRPASSKTANIKQESESESDSSESDSESGAEEDTNKPKFPKTLSQDTEMKDACSGSSEEEEEPDEKPTEKTKAPVVSKANGRNAKVARSGEFVESESSESEEDSGSNSLIPLQLHGSGFQFGSISTQDAKVMRKLAKDAQASGQKLLVFSMPASIPVTIIEKMTIDINKIKEGRALLTHNGDQYTMTSEDPSTSKEVTLTVADKGVFAKATHPNQIYHLEQVRTTTVPHAQPSIAKKAPRPQPKNLKLRCPTIGVKGKNLGKIDPNGTGSDEEEEDVEMTEPPTPNTKASPKAPEEPVLEKSKSKKRKHAEAPDAKAAATEDRQAASPAKKIRFEEIPSEVTRIVPGSVVAAKKAALAQYDVTPIEPPVYSTGLGSSQPTAGSTKKAQTPKIPSSSTIKETPILPPFPKLSGMSRPSSTPVPIPSSQRASSPVVAVDTPSKKRSKRRKKASSENVEAAEPEAADTSTLIKAEPDTPRKSTEAGDETKQKKSKKSKSKKAVLEDAAPRQVTPVMPPHVPGMKRH
ncbi:hypothetical protein MKZ38_005061 [Zalerion maritima]|uniref:Uncharacterized protein n=1 Tax=Zalerion maritima TaxID=339359 RepID=A0AAD5WQI4_9PEZI|nr:hypothetical protein MKZ38_005061 [Zalerion maritima]